MASAIGPIIAALIAASPQLIQMFKGGNNNTHQTGLTQNFDPQFLSQLQNSGLQTSALDTLRSQMQPFDANQYMDFFNQGVVDPSLRNYREEVLPEIQNRFMQGGATHTTALNRAIGRSAENLSQGLGSLRAQYLNQGQTQWRNSQNQAAAQSLGLLQNAYGGTPLVQGREPGQGMEFIKSLLSSLGQYGASKYDPSKGFSQWFGDSSSPANQQSGSRFDVPFNSPSLYAQNNQPYGTNDPFGGLNPTDYLKNQIGRGY